MIPSHVRHFQNGASCRRLYFAIILVIGATVLPVQPASADIRIWTGNAANNDWTTGTNWAGSVAPQALDDLVFPAGPVDLIANNNFAAGTTFNSITFSGTGYVLTGNAITLSDDLVNTAGLGVNRIDFPIALSNGFPPIVVGRHIVNISNSLGSISLNAALSGGTFATLEKEGAGTLILTGGASNTHVATTIVNGGTLNLVKQSGTIAIAAALTIGDGVGGMESDVVRLVGNSHQIANTSAITINGSGLLDLNGTSDTIGPLTLLGGHVETDAGTVTLNGDVSATSSLTVGIANIRGNLSLGTASRTFDVYQSPQPLTPNLVIDAVISGSPGVGFTKIGNGSLSLFASNTYTGPTVVNAGSVAVYHAMALGTTAGGTSIAPSCSLSIIGVAIGSEPLAVASDSSGLSSIVALGSAAWAGDITLSGEAMVFIDDPGVFAIGGLISGSGSLALNAPGPTGLLVLHSPNAYTGSTFVNGGTLRLGANGRLPDTSIVDIGSTGTFDVNGVAETIAGLTGNGQVTLDVGSLTIAASVISTFSGSISGTGPVGLVKTGPGSFALAGNNNTYTGTTTVNAGTLFVDGAQASSPVIVAGGALGGSGIVGSLTTTVGSVSPGHSPGDLGAAGAVTLNAGSVLRIELNGPDAASYDRLSTAGPVTISGATLLVSRAFTPEPGTVFTILQDVFANPITGTFAGLPEGSTLNVDGVILRISYVGGTGNDVTLSFVSVQTYLSEGATGDFFDTQIALVNPSTTTPVNATLKFLKTDATTVGSPLAIPALGRRTVNVKDVPDMNPAEFSTVVESDYPLIVDRTMTWDATGYGSHAGTSVPSPEITWYLAEGATHSNFNLFYLIQNPNESPADVQVTYLLPTPAAPLVKTYSVLPNSRFNIWVNLEDPALAATDVSAVFRSTNGVSIIVERAMYLNSQGLYFGAGHESAAITRPSLNWFLAEGATGDYFDLFVLIANSTPNDAQVTATYLLPSGTTVQKNYIVTARSRFNIWVDLEDPQLAATAVSTTISSTNGVPIIVERAMWWPGGAPTWHEAHNSPGSTETGLKWGLAEGEVGGARSLETYILIANTSATPGTAQVTLLLENGTTAGKLFTLNPNSRFNVAVGEEFPGAAGSRFGAIIESIGDTPAQIVVERAMYSSVNGVVWAAGTNALATKLQ